MAELISQLSPSSPRKRLLTPVPWLLSAPGAIFFLTLLGMPLIMTLILSFNSFDYSVGIVSSFGLENYREVLSDSYFGQNER